MSGYLIKTDASSSLRDIDRGVPCCTAQCVIRVTVRRRGVGRQLRRVATAERRGRRRNLANPPIRGRARSGAAEYDSDI